MMQQDSECPDRALERVFVREHKVVLRLPFLHTENRVNQIGPRPVRSHAHTGFCNLGLMVQ
jgi:hypothetical protein